MKRLLFLVAVIMAAVGCSQDERTEFDRGLEIDFRTAMKTRASETTTADLDEIFVTAIDATQENYFIDVKFSKDGSYFTSETPYYWPADGSMLNFYAYAPNSTDLGSKVTIDKTAKTLADFAPATTIADQKDFITAKATGSKTNEATGVALTFSHRLSQIEVKAKNTNNTYTYKVQGVRIANPVSKGSFDFGTNTWNLSEEKADKAVYEVVYADGKTETLTATPVSIMGNDGDNAMLIPQRLTAWNAASDNKNAGQGAYLAVKINISKQDGGTQIYPAAEGEYGWAAVAINTNWEPGKKYVYTLDFSNGAGKVDPTDPDRPGEDILGSPIRFTVKVDEWQNADQDVEM